MVRYEGARALGVDATSMEAMWRGCDGESEDEEKGWNGMEVGWMVRWWAGGIEQSTIAGRLNSAFWLMAKGERADLSLSSSSPLAP